MKKYIWIIGFLLILLGCQNKPAEQAVACREEVPVNVIVQTFQPDTLLDYVEVSGKLEAMVDVKMVSETQGKIRKLHKKLGDFVRKDEAIGETDNDIVCIQLKQAKANLLSAEVGYETAQLNMQAAERLFETQQISQTEYDQAQIATKQAQAQLEGAKVSLESAQKAYDNSLLLAPVSGYIAELNIELGEYLAMGQTVCSIIDYNRLKIATGIGESQIFNLTKEQSVDVFASRYQQPFVGKIYGIGMKPLQETGNYPLEIEVDNTDQLLVPGMVVSAKILSRTYRDVLFTSLDNLIREYDTYFAYIVNDANQVEKRRVTIGNIIHYTALIEGGIAPGDRLIVDGIDSVVDGAQVNIRKGLE